MILEPLSDRVVIKKDPAEEKTSGGLFLPEQAQEKPQYGTVVSVGKGAIGPEGKRIPLEVTPGDRVLYSKYSGTTVKDIESELLILAERDILAVVECVGSLTVE